MGAAARAWSQRHHARVAALLRERGALVAKNQALRARLADAEHAVLTGGWESGGGGGGMGGMGGMGGPPGGGGGGGMSSIEAFLASSAGAGAPGSGAAKKKGPKKMSLEAFLAGPSSSSSGGGTGGTAKASAPSPTAQEDATAQDVTGGEAYGASVQRRLGNLRGTDSYAALPDYAGGGGGAY